MTMRFFVDRRGASAVEVAFIIPGVMFLALGIVEFSMLTFAEANLHSATEAAARYASVTAAANNNTDPGATAVNAFAAKVYKGPSIGQTFTYSTAGACGSTGANGHAVTGTGAYSLYYGFGHKSVTLNAAACFP
jgi:Flp pilus assembly protein TadG